MMHMDHTNRHPIDLIIRIASLTSMTERIQHTHIDHITDGLWCHQTDRYHCLQMVIAIYGLHDCNDNTCTHCAMRCV